jgi:spermidine synthase
MNPIYSGIYIAGFTASGLEFLLIMAFQTYLGYVYSAIGIIIAIFMAGLAAGSLLSTRYQISKKHFSITQILLIVASLLFPVIWFAMRTLSNNLSGLSIFFIYTFILSFLLGFQFAAGNKLCSTNSTQSIISLYTIDLFGAAIGVVLISIILVPLMGVIYSSIALATLNLIALMLNLCKKP